MNIELLSELGLLVGIELEGFYDSDKRGEMHAIADEYPDVVVGSDGSIVPDDDGSYNSVEIYPAYPLRVSEEDEIGDFLSFVSEFKRRVGLKVNSSCGTHIHFSLESGMPDGVTMPMMADAFLAATPLAYALGGRRGWRRRSNSYARSSLLDVIGEGTPLPSGPAMRAYNGLFRSEKSWSLRLVSVRQRHFEMRAFPGTANILRLKTYLSLVFGVMEALATGRLDSYRGENGMLIDNPVFYGHTKQAIKAWLEILDWKQGGEWLGKYGLKQSTAVRQVDTSLVRYLTARGVSREEADDWVGEALGG